MTFIIQLDQAFPGGELLSRDKMVNAGTYALVDIGNTFCYPKGALASPGNKANNGDVLFNLAERSPDASVFSNANGLSIAKNGIDLGSVPSALSAGGAGINIPGFIPLTNSLLAIAWLFRSSADNGSGQVGILSATNGTADHFGMIKNSTDNLFLAYGGPGDSGASITIGLGSIQVAVSVVFSGGSYVRTAYVNGAAVGSSFTGSGSTFATLTGTTNIRTRGRFGNSLGQIMQRYLIEDLTVSGKNPLDQVIADYALNAARFV